MLQLHMMSKLVVHTVCVCCLLPQDDQEQPMLRRRSNGRLGDGRSSAADESDSTSPSDHEPLLPRRRSAHHPGSPLAMGARAAVDSHMAHPQYIHDHQMGSPRGPGGADGLPFRHGGHHPIEHGRHGPPLQRRPMQPPRKAGPGQAGCSVFLPKRSPSRGLDVGGLARQGSWVVGGGNGMLPGHGLRVSVPGGAQHLPPAQLRRSSGSGDVSSPVRHAVSSCRAPLDIRLNLRVMAGECANASCRAAAHQHGPATSLVLQPLLQKLSPRQQRQAAALQRKMDVLDMIMGKLASTAQAMGWRLADQPPLQPIQLPMHQMVTAGSPVAAAAAMAPSPCSAALALSNPAAVAALQAAQAQTFLAAAAGRIGQQKSQVLSMPGFNMVAITPQMMQQLQAQGRLITPPSPSAAAAANAAAAAAAAVATTTCQNRPVAVSKTVAVKSKPNGGTNISQLKIKLPVKEGGGGPSSGPSSATAAFTPGPSTHVSSATGAMLTAAATPSTLQSPYNLQPHQHSVLVLGNHTGLSLQRQVSAGSGGLAAFPSPLATLPVNQGAAAAALAATTSNGLPAFTGLKVIPVGVPTASGVAAPLASPGKPLSKQHACSYMDQEQCHIPADCSFILCS